MAAITLSPAERERLRDELQNYCAENFNVELEQFDAEFGNDSNLLIVFYVQIMPDDFVMQLHRF